MQLFSGQLSPFSTKIRIYLAERGIAADVVNLPWTRATLWEPKPDGLLRASSRGEVPVLVDGDVIVTDSTLIWQYLEDMYAEQPLAPAAPLAAAHCRRWEDEADWMTANPVSVLIREGFNKPDGSGDAAALGAAREQLTGYYAELDSALAETDFLCGEYSIADIASLVCITFAQTLGAPIPVECRNTSAWYERVCARPHVTQEIVAVAAAAAAA